MSARIILTEDFINCPEICVLSGTELRVLFLIGLNSVFDMATKEYHPTSSTEELEYLSHLTSDDFLGVLQSLEYQGWIWYQGDESITLYAEKFNGLRGVDYVL